MRIIFATGNAHKMKEIREILGDLTDLGILILSMREAGAFADPEEDGQTFEENALIKARAVAGILQEQALSQDRPDAHKEEKGDIVLSDDSGLCIDYLDGAPGIYSARFMGHETSYDLKNKALLEKLISAKGKERSARFVCAVAAVLPDGREVTVRGVMEGEIADKISGANGFGYDPIFYLPEYGKTSAEISEEEKNAISHRGRALRSMEEKLKEILPEFM